MEAAKADLDKAKWNLDNCEIRAPVSGIILKKSAEKGNIVNPSAFSNGISSSLCDMADLSDLEVDLKIQERDIAKVVKGMPCTAMPEAYQADRAVPEDSSQGLHRLCVADACRRATAVRERFRCASSSTFPRAKRAFISSRI